MSILSGFFKTIKYRLTDTGYKWQSEKTSSQTVVMGDGTDNTDTAEKRFGAIKGLTSSTSVTETGYALDATIGKKHEDSIAALNESLVTESKTRNTEDIKLSASVSEVASSVTSVASTANTANATALSAIRARTKNIKVTVSNGVATIPFSSISSDVKTSNYVDALIDIFSSNDYIICRKWQNGTNLYVFIRNCDGSILTSGNLTFQITAFITM